MEIRDTFNIFNLFLDKKIKVYVGSKFFHLRLPTIKEFSLEDTINSTYHIWTLPTEKLQQMIPVPVEDAFHFINIVLFQIGMYREYQSVVINFKTTLQFFIPNIKIDYKQKELKVDDIIITNEI